MKAELVPENGDPAIPIVRDVTIVGRRSSCDVVIDHHSLSRRHCVVVKTDGLLVIRDLVTTNGTKVKGQRVRWAALMPDDRISMGAYKMRVYLGPDDMPSPSEGRAARGARPPVGAASALGVGVGAGVAGHVEFAKPSESQIAVAPRAPIDEPVVREDFQFEILDDEDDGPILELE